MNKLNENKDKLIQFIRLKFESGEIDNDCLLELIKVSGEYLNLKTIPAYAKSHSLTYQGVKVTRRIENLFGVKFIIDNK